MGIRIDRFGSVGDSDVFKVTLTNSKGTSAEFLTFGATWHSYVIKSKKGSPVDVIVGPKTLGGYVSQFQYTPYFFGSTVGRYAGRINCQGISSFLKNHVLTHQNGVQLHGGNGGFSVKHWKIAKTDDQETPSVTFSYLSHHLEEGYPGELEVEVTYTLFPDDSLSIIQKAETTQDTLVNLTNHAYFNLGNEPITEHSLHINSDHILEVTPELIPTGKLLPTQGTPYDFKKYPLAGQISSINGLDDTFLFDKTQKEDSNVKFRSEASGLEMSIFTNQPAAVVFAPKSIKFSENPKNPDLEYSNFPAICFETQNYPDAPNHRHFPTAMLKKNEAYENKSIFSFKTVK